MSSIFASDDWTISTAQTDGEPLIIRHRPSLPGQADRHLYPNLIIVSWPYPEASNGLPDEATSEDFAAFDDALGGALDSGWGVEAVAITGCGKKEWRFYTRDPEEFAEGFNAALADCPPFPIELTLFEDPEWDGLAEMLPESN